MPDRFALLHYGLDRFCDLNEARFDGFPLRDRVRATRYPIRALRYWWPTCAIAAEAATLDREPVVVDAGCNRGQLARFAKGAGVRARWTGLDVLRRPEAESHYDDIVCCDIDEEVPLPTGMADVVVCLHVLEHLPDPARTVSELARLLRPGGLLCLATPVSGRGIAWMRQRVFNRRQPFLPDGTSRHVQAFWPRKLRCLATDAGLYLEFAASSHIIRLSGWRIENSPLWLRMNQAAGALLPSLGQEYMVAARAAGPPTVGEDVAGAPQGAPDPVLDEQDAVAMAPASRDGSGA